MTMSHEQVLQDIEKMIRELKKEREVLNDLLADMAANQEATDGGVPAAGKTDPSNSSR